MRYISLFNILFLFVIVEFSHARELMGANNQVVVYAHSSLAKELVRSKVFSSDKLKTDVKIVSIPNTGQLVARLVMEKRKPKADLVLGIDDSFYLRLKKEKLLYPYQSKGLKKVKKFLLEGLPLEVAPIDYGYLSFVYDARKIKVPPRSMKEFLKPEYKKQIIIQDPRLSAPGAILLKWTMALYDKDYLDFWKKIKSNILTTSNNWSTAYGLFVSGEAPFVFSYITSPAYHIQHEQVEHYKSIAFEGGNYLQVEYAAIINKPKINPASKLVLDFLLGEEFQSLIPFASYMFPVLEGVKQPAAYQKLPKVLKPVTLDPKVWEADKKKVLRAWLGVM